MKTTLIFEDNSEFDLDKNNMVTRCRPFGTEIHEGTIIANPVIDQRPEFLAKDGSRFNYHKLIIAIKRKK